MQLKFMRSFIREQRDHIKSVLQKDQGRRIGAYRFLGIIGEQVRKTRPTKTIDLMSSLLSIADLLAVRGAWTHGLIVKRTSDCFRLLSTTKS
jgi:hypothetical protein